MADRRHDLERDLADRDTTREQLGELSGDEREAPAPDDDDAEAEGEVEVEATRS